MKLNELECSVVDSLTATSFISKYHYSHTCPNVVLAIGEFYKNKLINCIVFNWCVGRNMASEVIEGGNAENVIELTRMVSLEPKPKNLESFSISRALKLLKKTMPKIEVVISYADNEMNHKGYCYQASNFIYYGQSASHNKYFIDNIRVHEKSLYNRYGTTSIEKLTKIFGDRFKVEKGFTKNRYYYILASNKKEYKTISSKIKVKSDNYPKGDNTKYNLFDSNYSGNIINKKKLF